MHQHSVAVKGNGCHASDATSEENFKERAYRLTGQLTKWPRDGKLDADNLKRIKKDKNSQVRYSKVQNKIMSDNLSTVALLRRDHTNDDVSNNSRQDSENLQGEKDNSCGVKSSERDVCIVRGVRGIHRRKRGWLRGTVYISHNFFFK